MLRPGKSTAVAVDTAECRKLSVSPAFLRIVLLKSEALMLARVLHSKPLVNVVWIPVEQVSCKLLGSLEQMLMQIQNTMQDNRASLMLGCTDVSL